ncbi:MAG: hypothetical protein ACI9DC_002177 [Gammaproteobacteria bacterium]|jgi:hypothetical protein
MAKDIGFTVHYPRAANTHCIGKVEKVLWIQRTSQIKRIGEVFGLTS